MPGTPTDGGAVLGAVAAGDDDGSSDSDTDAEGEVGVLPPALVGRSSPTQLVTIIAPRVRITALVTPAPNAVMPEERPTGLSRAHSTDDHTAGQRP